MFLTNLIHYEPITDLNIDHFKHRKVQTCHKAIMPFDPFLPETVHHMETHYETAIKGL